MMAKLIGNKYHRVYRKGDGFWRWLKWSFVPNLWRWVFPRWSVVDESRYLGGRNGVSIIRNGIEVYFVEWVNIDLDRAYGHVIRVPNVPTRVLVDFVDMVSRREPPGAK